jgi:hypothetical protein
LFETASLEFFKIYKPKSFKSMNFEKQASKHYPIGTLSRLKTAFWFIKTAHKGLKAITGRWRSDLLGFAQRWPKAIISPIVRLEQGALDYIYSRSPSGDYTWRCTPGRAPLDLLGFAHR